MNSDQPKTRGKAERFNFTEKRLAQVNPPAKGYTAVYDVTRPGLVYMVTANDARTFYAYYKFEGRPYRYRLSAQTVESARAAYLDAMHQVSKGINPHFEKQAQRREQTLASYFDEYAKTAGKKKRSIGQDRSNFDRYCGDIKNSRLGDINKRDVETLHAKIGEKHGEYSANRVLSMLSTLFYRAHEAGIIPAVPTLGVEKFEEHIRTRFLQPDEISRFFKAVEKFKKTNPLMADIFTMALYTGQRRSNVCGMKWADVDLQRMIWTIPAHTAKGKKIIAVSLTPDAAKLLKARKRCADGDYVFPSHGETGHVVETKDAWKKLLTMAKLKDVRMHDLRRTVGSYAAIGNASDRMIAAALGQTSQQATNHYAHLRTSEAAATLGLAMDAINAAKKSRPRVSRATGPTMR